MWRIGWRIGRRMSVNRQASFVSTLLLVLTAGLACLGLATVTPSGAAAQAAQGAEKSIRILGLGDSLMAGFGLPAEDAFVGQLEAALGARGHNVTVINAGVSGDTTAGGRARLAWSLAEPVTHAIVELGANDALRGLEPAETEANLRAILSELTSRGIPVLLCGMLAPRNLGPDYAAEFDSLYPRLAEEFGVVFYPFFLDGVAREADLNQADGIHPNPAGVAIIVERIVPFAERLIAQ